MKKWIVLILALNVSAVLANCHVFIPEKNFYHSSGYGISFEFTEDLLIKGYVEVENKNEADFILQFQGNEIKGRFNKAQALIEMGKINVSETKTCLSQLCSIYDYRKVFKKVYDSFFLLIPPCHSMINGQGKNSHRT